jgi:hypothetical protein
MKPALYILGIFVAEVFAARMHVHRFGLVVLLGAVSILIAGVWRRNGN